MENILATFVSCATVFNIPSIYVWTGEQLSNTWW